MSEFSERLETLRRDIVDQGERVFDIVLSTVESYFDLDREQATAVIAADDTVDKVDVEIERDSIPLLGMGVTDEHSIRSVLTIVKINNELERIADAAVVIAEIVESYPEDLNDHPPDTFRVMANSVIGMLRDANRSFAQSNTTLAQRVLVFDDTVARFREEISLQSQEEVAAGRVPVQFAFRLAAVVKALERIADHCTNICEQVIYLESGKIVRHRPEGWSDPIEPT